MSSNVVVSTLPSSPNLLYHTLFGDPAPSWRSSVGRALFIRLMSEDDEELIETIWHLLHVYKFAYHCTPLNRGQLVNPSGGTTLIQSFFHPPVALVSPFHPTLLFLHLLATFSFDHSVLLDLLISPETIFLQYLIDSLKFILNDNSSTANADVLTFVSMACRKV